MQPDAETPHPEPTEYTHQEVRPIEALVTEPTQESPAVELQRLSQKTRELTHQVKQDAETLSFDFESWLANSRELGVSSPPSRDASSGASYASYYFESVDEAGEKKGLAVSPARGEYLSVREYSQDKDAPSEMQQTGSFYLHFKFGVVEYMSLDAKEGKNVSSSIDYGRDAVKVHILNDKDPLIEGGRILDGLKRSQLKGVLEGELSDGPELVVYPLPGIEGPGQTIRFAPPSSDSSQNSQ